MKETLKWIIAMSLVLVYLVGSALLIEAYPIVKDTFSFVAWGMSVFGVFALLSWTLDLRT